MLTDEQKQFLLELLTQYKAGCPHFYQEGWGHQAMVDRLIALLTTPPAPAG